MQAAAVLWFGTQRRDLSCKNAWYWRATICRTWDAHAGLSASARARDGRALGASQRYNVGLLALEIEVARVAERQRARELAVLGLAQTLERRVALAERPVAEERVVVVHREAEPAVDERVESAIKLEDLALARHTPLRVYGLAPHARLRPVGAAARGACAADLDVRVVCLLATGDTILEASAGKLLTELHVDWQFVGW